MQNNNQNAITQLNQMQFFNSSYKHTFSIIFQIFQAKFLNGKFKKINLIKLIINKNEVIFFFAILRQYK